MADPRAQLSLAQIVADLDEVARDAVLSEFDPETIAHNPYFWLRPSQLLPMDRGDSWSLCAVISGRGFGKRLAVDTPVPTPTGWTTMGDLRAGDWVLDEAGDPCRVLVAHDIEMSDGYRMHFVDGTSIDACGDHLWVTWEKGVRDRYTARHPDASDFPENWPTYRLITRQGEHGPQIRTTTQIFESQTVKAAKQRNHCIPLALPLDLPEIDLPLDPWVLGAWLGNGVSSSHQIVAGSKDGNFDSSHYLGCLAAAGFTANAREHPDHGYTVIGVIGLRTVLRSMSLLGNKHVPKQYLRACIEQRLALLRGLMDTDGTVGQLGRVAFYSTTRDLAESVLELARSLSERPVLRTGRSTRDGVDHGPLYSVEWYPSKFNPFALARKARLADLENMQGLKRRHRMVTEVVPLPEPVSMRCITVDSLNSMYLVGEGMIPTHNTRMMSEWVCSKATAMPGSRGALIGRTAADVRDVLVLGESGILAVSPPGEKPEYSPSKRLLEWSNGSQALLMTSEAPDQARGPQMNWAAGDELASWLFTVDDSGLNMWDNVQLATRLGDNPQIMVATTPRRTPFMRSLMARKDDPRTLLITGTIFDNAHNLSKVYLDNITGIYGGTRLAKQELEGILLEDVEGALFQQEMFDSTRLIHIPDHPLRVVAVDPSVAEKPRDECGIVVLGGTNETELYKRHCYVLEDASLLASPTVWAQRVVEMAHKWSVFTVIAEGNQGGELVANAIREMDPNLRVLIVHARVNKATRAEPVAVMWDAGRMHMVGVHPELESQMTSWNPADTHGVSPGRLDACVWGATALAIKPPAGLHGGSLRSSRTVARRRITLPSIGMRTGASSGRYADRVAASWARTARGTTVGGGLGRR
jgi:phage terminase large subunit-like protein